MDKRTRNKVDYRHVRCRLISIYMSGLKHSYWHPTVLHVAIIDEGANDGQTNYSS